VTDSADERSVGRVYIQHASATEGSVVIQVGGDLYLREDRPPVRRAASVGCPYPGLDPFGPDQARGFSAATS
jgi:hypothetical protein